MLVKKLLVCGVCVGINAAVPALEPATGSAAERFLHYGLVPAFMVKLSQEQLRWAALESSGRLPLLAQPTAAQDSDCCGGIPPWHLIYPDAHTIKAD